MQIITDLGSFHTERPTAVAIGKFDGVHLGHRKLLRRILEAKEQGLRACVLTFDPLPEVYFAGLSGKDTDGCVLSTREEKRRIFDQMGVDLLVEMPFNQKTAGMDPSAFVRGILCGKLHAAMIAAGPDLSFGDRGLGNFALLREMAPSCGFSVVEISKVAYQGNLEEYRGQPISSTMVRNFVREGKMEEVAACLGDPYQILGTVLHGNAIGRTIGIRTVNQIPEKDKLLPPHGVYYSHVMVDGHELEGMTNIGVKPTVTSAGAVTVETHLYDFRGDLYGRVIATSLLTYRRPEKKFPDLAALEKSMEQDLAAGEEYFRAGRDH